MHTMDFRREGSTAVVLPIPGRRRKACLLGLTSIGGISLTAVKYAVCKYVSRPMLSTREAYVLVPIR